MQHRAWVLLLATVFACSGLTENVKFSAVALSSSVSPGGRWEVVIKVTNEGPEAGTPDCLIKAIDADGIMLAGDSVTLDKLAAGESVTTRVLTGLRPGKHQVSRWRVTCG